jgi:hypothetical protein
MNVLMTPVRMVQHVWILHLVITDANALMDGRAKIAILVKINTIDFINDNKSFWNERPIIFCEQIKKPNLQLSPLHVCLYFSKEIPSIDLSLSNNIVEVERCPDCVNGGTCVEENGDFRCMCPSGWKGDVCEEGRLPTFTI